MRLAESAEQGAKKQRTESKRDGPHLNLPQSRGKKSSCSKGKKTRNRLSETLNLEL